MISKLYWIRGHIFLKEVLTVQPLKVNGHINKNVFKSKWFLWFWTKTSLNYAIILKNTTNNTATQL